MLLVLLVAGWGVAVAPFDWKVDWLPCAPVLGDAIKLKARVGKYRDLAANQSP